MGIFRCFRKRRYSKGLVAASFFLLFTTLFSYSQDKFLRLLLEPEKVVKNDYLYITILVDHPNPEALSLTPPEFPQGLQLYWGPNIRPKTVSAGGETRRITEITYKFRARESGWFLIDSFTIAVGTTLKYETLTEPKSFGVGIEKEDHLVVPPEGEWVVEKPEVLQGETIPVTLRLNEQESIGVVTGINVKPPSEGIFERVDTLGDISKKILGDRELYSVPVASFMYTPVTTGRVQLPEAFIDNEFITVKAEGKSIQVLPLPEEISSSGAIGDFILEAFVEESDLKIGDEAVLHVRLQGEGNLNYCKLPEPSFTGGALTNQENRRDYQPDRSGYRGYQENIYTYSVISASSPEISIPRFSWYDPDGKEIKQRNSISIPLTLQPAHSVSSPGHDSGKEIINIKGIEEISLNKTREFYNSARSYALLIPGVLAFIFCLVFKKVRFLFISIIILFVSAGKFEEPSAAFDYTVSGINFFDSGMYEEAEQQFKNVLNILPHNGDILYNLGAASYQQGNRGEALYYLRKANYYNPRDKLVIKSIKIIEEELSLSERSANLYTYHPRFFFILFILLCNAALFSSGIYYLFRKSIYAIAMILLITLTFGSAGMLTYSAVERNRTLGVVSTETAVKKIPGNQAGDWFFMREGTSVRLLYSEQEYHFIQTESGIKGWIPEESLLII